MDAHPYANTDADAHTDRNGYADMDANTADANGDIHRLAHVDGNKHGNADLDTGC